MSSGAVTKHIYGSIHDSLAVSGAVTKRIYDSIHDSLAQCVPLLCSV